MTNQHREGSARALAGVLVTAGVAHFVVPKQFDEIVPRALPGAARFWTLSSGVAEIAVGVAVAAPRTRRVGAGLAALLFLAVFPANAQMAADWAQRPLKDRLVAFGRLPLQVPLIRWAWKVRATA